MLSSIFFTLVSATVVLAAPGDYDYTHKNVYTTCSASLCTKSAVETKPTVLYSTKIIYIPQTEYKKTQYLTTKTLTKKTTTVYDVPYETVCTEYTNVPYTVTKSSESICPITSSYAITKTYVETKTVCATKYPDKGHGW
jgi:hypothetical protein